MKSSKKVSRLGTKKLNEKIINLTPWRIILENQDTNSPSSDALLDLPPATHEATLASTMTSELVKIDDNLSLTFFDTKDTVIVGLPQPSESYLIVTPVILETLRGTRDDCITPCIFGPYGSLEMVDNIFVARTVGFLRGSFA
jgi:hypothetical protein